MHKDYKWGYETHIRLFIIISHFILIASTCLLMGLLCGLVPLTQGANLTAKRDISGIFRVYAPQALSMSFAYSGLLVAS